MSFTITLEDQSIGYKKAIKIADEQHILPDLTVIDDDLRKTNLIHTLILDYNRTKEKSK